MAGGENGIVKTLEDYKINIQAPSNDLYEKMKSKSKIAVPKKISWQKIAEQLYISGYGCMVCKIAGHMGRRKRGRNINLNIMT